MRALGVAAGIIAAVCGTAWALTAGAAQSCTLASQLEGSTCYPALQSVHVIAGPVALVAAVGALILFIAAPRDDASTLPRCLRCGYPAEAHANGRCPVPPPPRPPQPPAGP